jgi:hypothetical protein
MLVYFCQNKSQKLAGLTRFSGDDVTAKFLCVNAFSNLGDDISYSEEVS